MVFITDAQEKTCTLFFLNTSGTTFLINDWEQRLTAARVASTLNLPGIATTGQCCCQLKTQQETCPKIRHCQSGI